MVMENENIILDDMDLFDEEIEVIREFSELDVELFHEVLNCTRDVVDSLGNSISPVMVVDIIEGAVGHLLEPPVKGEDAVTVYDAVNMAVDNLHLSDMTSEMVDMLDDNYDLDDVTNIQRNM